MEQKNLKRPNVFQVDRTESYYEVPTEFKKQIQLRCPHCSTTGIFPSALPYGLRYPKHIEAEHPTLTHFFSSIHICPNDECAGIAFVISDGKKVVNSFPPQLIDFKTNDIPEMLTRTLQEAISCHSVQAYRGCAMLVRRLLEEICHTHEATGQSLHAKIQDLKSKVTLSQDLLEAMLELKLLGNDAAHVDARNYDTIDEMEAQSSIELAKELLKALYQHKSLVSQLRALKNAN